MVLFLFVLIPLACGQDFNGTWKLKSQQVEFGTLPEPPPATLEIDQRGNAVRCGTGTARWTFTTDGKDARSRTGQRSLLTTAKWEGSALLINTIVSDSGRNYTLMDRWTVSRDRMTLTVFREIAGRNIEATMVYVRADAPQPALASRPAEPAAAPPAPPAAPPAGGWRRAETPAAPSTDGYVIEAGTRLLLALENSVSMKHSLEGDRVYLRTAYPVLSKGVVVIPTGSQVAGTLTFVKHPGKVKGRGEVFIRFDSLTLPNGVTRDFRARIQNVDASTRGHVGEEGSIKGEGKPGEAGTIGQTTAGGATAGTIGGAAAGHAVMGAAIGAAAGAVAGVLLAHGQDTVLEQGSTVEMILNHPLVFTREEIPRR